MRDRQTEGSRGGGGGGGEGRGGGCEISPMQPFLDGHRDIILAVQELHSLGQPKHRQHPADDAMKQIIGFNLSSSTFHSTNHAPPALRSSATSPRSALRCVLAAVAATAPVEAVDQVSVAASSIDQDCTNSAAMANNCHDKSMIEATKSHAPAYYHDKEGIKSEDRLADECDHSHRLSIDFIDYSRQPSSTITNCNSKDNGGGPLHRLLKGSTMIRGVIDTGSAGLAAAISSINAMLDKKSTTKRDKDSSSNRNSIRSHAAVYSRGSAFFFDYNDYDRDWRDDDLYCGRSRDFQPLDFLSRCYLCMRSLACNDDIFMYNGDKAFCSVECRYQQILEDEQHKGSADCQFLYKSWNCHHLRGEFLQVTPSPSAGPLNHPRSLLYPATHAQWKPMSRSFRESSRVHDTLAAA